MNEIVDQAFQVARRRRGDKFLQWARVLLGRRVEPRTVFGDMLTCAMDNLSAGGLAPAENAHQFFMVVAKDIVQQKRRSLDRREPLEQKQERHGKRFLQLRCIEWRKKRIAVAGVSGDTSRHPVGNRIYYRLKTAGHEVFTVNPHMQTFEGDRCYADV